MTARPLTAAAMIIARDRRLAASLEAALAAHRAAEAAIADALHAETVARREAIETAEAADAHALAADGAREARRYYDAETLAQTAAERVETLEAAHRAAIAAADAETRYSLARDATSRAIEAAERPLDGLTLTRLAYLGYSLGGYLQL